MKTNETINYYQKEQQDNSKFNDNEFCTKPFDYEYARAEDEDQACHECDS